MTLWGKVFGFPSLTLAAIPESLLAIKLFPDYYNSQSHLATVIAIIAVNYALGAFFWVVVYPNFLSPLRRIPGPREVFHVAHRTLMVKDGPSGDLFLNLVKRYPNEELINLNTLGDHILIAKPRLLADLFVHRCYHFTKPTKVSSFLRHILGDGLIIVEGDHHKFLRKNTMPAFHFRHIKDLYPMMWEKAEILARTLRKEIDQQAVYSSEKPATTESRSGVIELNTWASKVTLDIIGVAGLGRDFRAVETGNDPLQQLFEQLLEPSRDKLVFSVASFIFGLSFVKLLPWKMNGVFAHLTTSLDDYCRPMIAEKKKAIAAKDDHFDILSLLIKSNNFSDDALKDQLITFLAAGHETTASALTWACYLLAKQPELQEKLREEVTEALPNGAASDSSTDLGGILEQLPYLNGIMHETLRLYPTVPMTMRQAICDTQIGDQFIPKGAVMIVSMWLINRSPDIWGTDAGTCRPERWINADGKPNQTGGTNSNYDFITFLHGPRSCIGQGFAKAEMRCLLASLVSAFSWDLAMNDSEVVPRGVITIKPENGMYLRFKALSRVG